MKIIPLISLVALACLGCREDQGRKPVNGVNTQATETTSPYIGEWKGRSESSPALQSYDWRFQLSRNGRFQITMSRDDTGCLESITGTWKSGVDGVTLFPDRPGKFFFPVVDRSLEKEGIGYPVFIKKENESFEFTIGCCDERGNDHLVKVTRAGP